MLPPTLPPTLMTTDEVAPRPCLHSQDPVVPQYRLDNLDLADRSTTFSPKTDVCIGRDPTTCTLVYPDVATLSRIHTKIFSMGPEVIVLDMSSNGTFVNGKIIGRDNRRVLRHGDVISVVNPHLPESTKLSWRFSAPAEESGKGGPAHSADASPLEREYILGDVLNSGNFAAVRLGVHRRSGKRVAVKIVEKKKKLSEDDFSYANLHSEAEIMRKLRHRNIVEVLDVYDEPKRFVMVMELVTGGDLFEYIVGRAQMSSVPFTETEAKKLFVQLLEAMLYMHSKAVVHRDLKPENVLVHVDDSFHYKDMGSRETNAPLIPVDKVTLKVSDFGLAKFCAEHEWMTTFCGTRTYLAPEVLTPDPRSKAQGYSWSVDVWSMGVILYVLLSGRTPFNGENPNYSKVEFHPRMSSISAEAKALICDMLRWNAEQRADLQDICNSAWLKSEVIALRHLAKAKDRVKLEGTMIQPLHVPELEKRVLVDDTKGTTTDVESDSDEKRPKKPRVDVHSGTATGTPPPKLVVWFWKKDLTKPDSDPKAWQAYPEGDCERIEKARHRGAKSAKVGNSNDYRISFEGLFQYSAKDPTKQRPVKRDES